jgi:hypothetical protein
MSFYSDAGREKLATLLINCIYIDLAICVIILIFSFKGISEYAIKDPLTVALDVGLVCIYIAIIGSIREKLLERKDEIWRSISEILATFYFFVHGIFYILIIGSFLSVLLTLQISSDFLTSWALIISALILVVFYLRNHGSSQNADYSNNWTGSSSFSNPKKIRYDSHSEDQSCYICGKKEGLPFRGHDGRFYCKDHILPENRVIQPGTGTSSHPSSPAPDTRCKNPFCMREIYHNDTIKCGPCGKSFCKYCWEGHRWSHGKAPAVGISYTAHGTFSGYDGSETIK